jgi:methoxymalonate biosynthesis acyl carrier protein
MSAPSVKQSFHNFLGKHLRVEVRDVDDIFAMGLVNSLFAMQLVQFTEQTFGIEIDAEDLHLDNFRSINAMAELVARKAAGAAPGGA